MSGGRRQPSPPSTWAPQQARVHGAPRSSPRIGGLLVLWMIGLALFPIRIAESVHDTSLPMLGLGPCNFSIGGSLHLFPQYGALFLFGVLLDIGRICVWMMLVSSFFTRSCSARSLMAAFLLFGVARSVQPLLTPGASFKHHELQCLTAIVMTLWLPYVLLSERVRRTFVQGSLSRSAVRVGIGSFVFLSIGLGAVTVRSYLRFDPPAFAASSRSRSKAVTRPTEGSPAVDFAVAYTAAIHSK